MIDGVSDDLLADLPNPRGDEPGSLRADIADELRDHLQCALRRELLKDADRIAAEQRVLAQFGDPRRVARQLWWQAMWSRIVTQRVLSGLQWLISVAAVLLAGIVCWQQATLLTELRASRTADNAERRSLAAVLVELQQQVQQKNLAVGDEHAFAIMPDAAGSGFAAPDLANLAMGAATGSAPSEPADEPVARSGRQTADEDFHAVPPPTSKELDSAVGLSETGAEITESPVPNTPQQPTLIVKLVRETSDGPALTEIKQISARSATGNYTGQGDESILLPTGVMQRSSTGRYGFHLQPDRYALEIHLYDGQFCRRQVLIRDAKSQELTVVCPGPRTKVPVLITIPPLPVELQEQNVVVTLSVNPGSLEIGSTQWYSPTLAGEEIRFDGKTGLASRVDSSDSAFELDQLPPDERVVFLPVGQIRYSLAACERPSTSGSVRLFTWPENLNRQNSELTENISSDRQAWKVELPPAFLDEILKGLQRDASESEPIDKQTR